MPAHLTHVISQPLHSPLQWWVPHYLSCLQRVLAFKSFHIQPNIFSLCSGFHPSPCRITPFFPSLPFSCPVHIQWTSASSRETFSVPEALMCKLKLREKFICPISHALVISRAQIHSPLCWILILKLIVTTFFQIPWNSPICRVQLGAP